MPTKSKPPFVTEHEEFEKYCADKAAEYVNTLCLAPVKICINAAEGYAKSTDESRMCKTFEVITGYPYRKVYIDYYAHAVKLYKEKNFKNLDMSILHELVHVLLSQCYFIASCRYCTEDELDNAWENLTDKLTIILKHFMECEAELIELKYKNKQKNKDACICKHKT